MSYYILTECDAASDQLSNLIATVRSGSIQQYAVADLAGRRGLYLIGTAVFCAAAIGCALAPSAAVLVVFRLVQALGAAAIIANGTALLTDAFPRTLLPTAMGISASAFAAFGLAGPTFGGLLVAGLGPRAIFWFAVPFCLAGLIFGARVLPRPHRRVREPFDPAGALLVAAALTGLMIVLTQGAEWGWLSTTTVAATVLTLMAGVAVVVVELRVRTH